MLLGNTISGVSLGLTTVLEELSAGDVTCLVNAWRGGTDDMNAPGRERVEWLLAVGATRIEATRNVVQRSLHVALIPMINQMSVVGIVSIPGMMTGEILAGVNPIQVGCHPLLSHTKHIRHFCRPLAIRSLFFFSLAVLRH